MTKYLVILSKDVYSDNDTAHLAIEDSGASVIKSFGESLMFEIDATEEQLSSISGVESSTAKDAIVSAKTEIAYGTDHLKALIDPTMNNVYSPMYDGTGTEVYIIDTGVSTSHQEFANATVNNLYSNFTADSTISDFDDENGHGSVVSAFIVGANIGVVPKATLHNVKLFNSSSADITVGEIIDALDAVKTHHLQTASSVKIVCMPWTIPQNNFVDAKVKELAASGLVMVAAAGNDGVDVNTKSPAGVDQIITAGVYNRQYNIGAFTNVPFSSGSNYVNNFGTQLDIFAMAHDVTAINPSSTDDYELSSGTSLAAGIVAGAAAQLVQRTPTASSADIKISLISEGTSVGNSLLVGDPDTGVDFNSVNLSIATSDAAGVPSFAGKQSGRIAKVQNGSTVTVDLQLSSSATDVQVLDFAPTPSWISLDTTTGIVTISPDFDNLDLIPGLFLFAVKGTMGDEVIVEEYSVGVYHNDEAELDSEVSSSYYYDADLDEYDAVVNYQVAPLIKS